KSKIQNLIPMSARTLETPLAVAPVAATARQVAVIDMGTSSVRMAVAEITAAGQVRQLETLAQAVNLGKDAFISGTISKATIEDCVRVLKSYRRILKEYQIENPAQVRVVATSAVREATNRLAFIDRIYIATGFQVEPLDEAEVIRITFLGVQPFLPSDPTLGQGRALVTEVGGGSTELLLVKGGDVVYSHTYRLGSLRLRETLEPLLAKELELSSVLISNANLRDGLLTEMAASDAWSKEFSKQIVRSAMDLGRKFNFDEAHAAHVAQLCSTLFNRLKEEHQLSPRYEVILQVAALLHEIGLFVSRSEEHKHSLYLIRNSELFGLGKKDLLLAALVARYHRRASPQPTHEGYAMLDRDERVAVAKMAAILRVADALDESRSQRIHEIQV